MDELIYGVWNGKVYDYRRRAPDRAQDELPLETLLTFNRGNPVAGFAGPQGFLMFDMRVTLAEFLRQYYARARELSCGRCTPCRMGTILIDEALEKAARGEGAEVDWEKIALLLRQMKETSLCGIGQTSPEPLWGALEYFPEMLRNAAPMPETTRDFYAVATAPCIEACPAHVNIPRYIDYIRDGHPELATAVLLRHYPLVGSCGRVCVRPCEKACVRNKIDSAVGIKDLKRHAADCAGAPIEDFFPKEERPVSPVSTSVAIVGAGPAGISCAYHLLRRGYRVDIFEQEAHAGGMARIGIPAYRLPNRLLETETEVITRLGGNYKFGQKFGRDFDIDDLFHRGYRAIFLGVGCSLGQYLGLPGEDTSAAGYLKGLDFLVDVEHAQSSGNVPELSGDVVVVGCGNVAMDCCRTARRLLQGSGKVTVSYRRTRASAPADPEEITAAIEEDIEFEFLTAPVEILTENGRVTGIRLVRMQEGEPDASGRRSVRPIEGSEFVIPCSTVIAAIGQKTDTTIFRDTDGIELSRRGTIVVNDALETSREGVFAGGDAAAGPTSLIWGMAQGETAAHSIHEYLMTNATGFIPRRRMSELIKEAKLLDDVEPHRAVTFVPHRQQIQMEPEVRKTSWEEAEHGLSPDDALTEALRCMRCYRIFAISTLRPIPGKSEFEEL